MTQKLLFRSFIAFGLLAGEVQSASAQSPDLRAQLDSAIPGFMRIGDVPGLEAAVIRDGKVYWTGAFGLREANGRERVDSNTVFVAASLTKPLFAYLVLRLADRGLVDLDKPVVASVPFFGTSTDPRIKSITPRMLLAHSSGLPNCCGPEWKLIGDPGSMWEYAPMGYEWLGQLVEHNTGMTLGALGQREIFEPLGMTHSTLVWNDTLEANAASPHTIWGVVARQTRPAAGDLDKANGCCSLRTTAGDYAKFLIAAMDGRGLNATTAPLLFTAQVELINARTQKDTPEALRRRMAWAEGFGLARTDSSHEFWQWGDYGDSKAFVIGDATRHTALVYFANAQTGLTIAGNIVPMVFPGEVYPLTMLGYPSINDLPRLARRGIVRAALDSGAAAGVRRFEWERSQHPERVGVQQVVEAAADLSAEHRLDAADTLLAIGGRLWPDSIAIPLARGDLYITLGANSLRASEFYRRALAITSTDTVTQARLQWALSDVKARSKPETIVDTALEKFVGTYGRAVISIRSHQLCYQLGTDQAIQLLVVGPAVFTPGNAPARRVRFEVAPVASMTEESITGIKQTYRRNP